ncbi:tetratricopeptide repeat protein [Comamonas antarctica]|uniref:Sel1 repeat family protein n=1 Tax=Comamonas antarctica TaxID=2743470 RepID=A0A6N1X540_9BURK|nr:SEL1-like repeat protein [Comamonas antarctica]QKV52900.1 sel1 repeat family protein [Comamonas antarctica]
MRTRRTAPRSPALRGLRPALGTLLALGLQLGACAQALATGPIADDRGLQRPASSPPTAASPSIDRAHVQPAPPTLGGNGRPQQHAALEQLRAQAEGGGKASQGPPAARKTAQRDAAWLLALLTLHGAGTPADPAAARQWFQRAHELGHPLAAAGLAWCAIDGCGSAPQPVAATPWIAALRRSDPARANYLEWLRARHLAPLQGTPRPPPPDGLLARAAAGGNPAAQVDYGLALLENNQRAAALKQFRQAAARSPAAAANAEWLSNREAGAEGVADGAAGARWLAEARRYHRGDGVPANYAEALRLYQRAANAGNAEARRMVETIFSRRAPDGGLDISWMQKLARMNLDAQGQAVPDTLAGAHAFAHDPTPLYDLVPPQWR